MKKVLQRGSSWGLRFLFTEELIEPINAPELAKQKQKFLDTARRWVETELPNLFDEAKEEFVKEVKKIRQGRIFLEAPKKKGRGH